MRKGGAAGGVTHVSQSDVVCILCWREWRLRATHRRRRYGIRGIINFALCVSQSLCVKITVRVCIPVLFASTFVYSEYNATIESFFASFLERSMSRPRQTAGPFRKELKNVPINLLTVNY